MVKPPIKYLLGAFSYPVVCLVYWVGNMFDRMHYRGLMLEQYDCYPWETKKIRDSFREELDTIIFNAYYADRDLPPSNPPPVYPNKKAHLTVIKGESNEQ